MIHTFTIDEFEDPRPGMLKTIRYRAHCDTCGEHVHVELGIVERSLAVQDAKQHARIAHDARDVAGNNTAFERIPEPEQRSLGLGFQSVDQRPNQEDPDPGDDRFTWQSGDVEVEKEKGIITTTVVTVIVEPVRNVQVNSEFDVYSRDNAVTEAPPFDYRYTREGKTQGTFGTWRDTTREIALVHVTRTRPSYRATRIARMTDSDAIEILDDFRGGAIAYDVTLIPR